MSLKLYLCCLLHINLAFLFSLKDIKCISKMNWTVFCFDRLIQGITRYKENNLETYGNDISSQIFN